MLFEARILILQQYKLAVIGYLPLRVVWVDIYYDEWL